MHWKNFRAARAYGLKNSENELCIEQNSALRVPSLKNLDHVKFSGAVLRKMSNFNHTKWVYRDATIEKIRIY